MVQIIGVSDARNNFSKLIAQVKLTKKPVVIVQDSSPSVVIYPYEEMEKRTVQPTADLLSLAHVYKADLQNLPANLRMQANKLLYTK